MQITWIRTRLVLHCVADVIDLDVVLGFWRCSSKALAPLDPIFDDRPISRVVAAIEIIETHLASSDAEVLPASYVCGGLPGAKWGRHALEISQGSRPGASIKQVPEALPADPGVRLANKESHMPALTARV